jgi:hypothetical protein
MRNQQTFTPFVFAEYPAYQYEEIQRKQQYGYYQSLLSAPGKEEYVN